MLSNFHRIVFCVIRLFAALAVIAGGASGASAQVLTDDFTGTSATMAWQVYGSACLTAGTGGGSIPACAAGVPGGLTGNTPDASGGGALLLTHATAYDSGGIVSLNSIPSSGGFTATFTAVSYGGTGADGISFFLLDAAQGSPASLGLPGGGLGYVGIPGGFLGIGVDEYGHFSAPDCGGTHCVGGPGFAPNTVALRGPTSVSNPYITGATPGFWLWSNSLTRQYATQHTYTITMTGAGMISVAVDGTTYISGVDATAQTGSLPAYLRVGIASSTGMETNIHQIVSFSVSSLSASNLLVSKTSSVLSDPVNGTDSPKAIPGATVRYCVIVTNITGNPTASAVTVTDVLDGKPVTYVPGSLRVNGTASGGACTWDGSPGGSFATNTVTATLPDLADGESSTIYFDATVN